MQAGLPKLLSALAEAEWHRQVDGELRSRIVQAAGEASAPALRCRWRSGPKPRSICAMAPGNAGRCVDRRPEDVFRFPEEMERAQQ